jgi:hypothetical protein
MPNLQDFPPSCLISKTAVIDSTVTIGPGCIIYGDGITICERVRLDAGCVVSEGVTVARNAWIRAGAVVLQSIPPNAIVEGNPAQVIGYQKAERRTGEPPEAKLINVQELISSPRPTKKTLGVGGAEIYLMRSITDCRGSLAVGEVPSELPFLPKRFFLVYGVPSIELRGEHAHKECEQYLMCIHGSCRVMVDDGTNRCEAILDRPDLGIYMPSMIWGTQYRYSQNAVLLVFASHSYDPNDYIRTYDEFLNAATNPHD